MQQFSGAVQIRGVENRKQSAGCLQVRRADGRSRVLRGDTGRHEKDGVKNGNRGEETRGSQPVIKTLCVQFHFCNCEDKTGDYTNHREGG